uniref:Uncharacterized protein n=1 Tax=Arundo donax TaxID=35708 RepID=A0A0A9D8U4_ARUDO
MSLPLSLNRVWAFKVIDGDDIIWSDVILESKTEIPFHCLYEGALERGGEERSCFISEYYPLFMLYSSQNTTLCFP